MNPLRTDGGKQHMARRSTVLCVDEVLVGPGRADGSDRVVGDSAVAKVLANA